jgi:hypothetical protein
MTLDTRRHALIRCLQDCATRAEHCAESAVSLPRAGTCVSACRDAAALCRLSAELLARESPMTSLVLPACELSCAACADACEEHFGSFFGDCARQCGEVQRAMDRLQQREGLSALA